MKSCFQSMRFGSYSEGNTRREESIPCGQGGVHSPGTYEIMRLPSQTTSVFGLLLLPHRILAAQSKGSVGIHRASGLRKGRPEHAASYVLPLAQEPRRHRQEAKQCRPRNLINSFDGLPCRPNKAWMKKLTRAACGRDLPIYCTAGR